MTNTIFGNLRILAKLVHEIIQVADYEFYVADNESEI